MRLLILGDLMKSFRVAVFLKFGESVGWGKGYLQAAPRLGATPGNPTTWLRCFRSPSKCKRNVQDSGSQRRWLPAGSSPH